MKKILTLVLLLGALSGTATAAPYYLTRPAAGELTPCDWQPVYSLDGIYNWTAKHKAPDTAGARLNFSLYNNAYSTVRHQFTLSAGYEAGTHHYSGATVAGFATPANSRLSVTLEKLPITLGYDLNVSLTDHVMLDLGLKGGYAFGFVDSKLKEPAFNGLKAAEYKDDISTGGFTYALTAGLKIQCTETIYMRLAYEFSRTYFTKHLSRDQIITQHGIVFGVGCTF